MDRSKRSPAAVIAGGLILAALIGCGREESVASKSAAAFREAQKRGETFGGVGHGHGAMTPGGGHEMPEAAAGASNDGHAGMAEGGMAGMAGMDHAGMAHQGKEGMAGMDHSGMAVGKDQSGKTMAGMQHGGQAVVQHGGHTTMEHGTMVGMPVPARLPAPAAVPPGQPARTLGSDALDAPAETSVLDAQRSAEMAEGMAGGGHGGHGSGTYRQVDAGREPAAQPESQEHKEHDHKPPAERRRA